MTASSPYDRPELYDLVAPSSPLAEAFYLEEARRRGGAALDLACGTGRFSIPLAKSGVEVVGGDISSSMLLRARDRAMEAGLEIDFVQLDMREFDLPGRQFGMIFIAANSILHLQDADEFRSCFKAVARHLKPGGVLIFDAFVTSMQILARDPAERHLVGQFADSRLGLLSLEETTDYDPASQISRITWFWSTPTKPDFLITPLQLRQVFPQEWPLLLQAGGLRLAARYGDFDRSAFNRQSSTQVCICETA
jgi:SAM-dependent methyltransferase